MNLEEILKMTSDDLHKAVSVFLLENNYKPLESNGEYLYATGNIPIMLVAHFDVYGDVVPTEIIYDADDKDVIRANGILGGDDRAGVWAITEIIAAGYRPHVLFCHNEEKGCIGAEKAAEDLAERVAGINYIIGLDRKGERDSVFYDCDNKEFEDYVNSFGFETAIGTSSDIRKLCPAWGIAGVNLSIGYERAHSINEYLYLRHTRATIEKVKKMLSDKAVGRYEYYEC